MRMKPKARRWLAMLVLGVLVFAQASIAFSACQLDRQSLPQAMGSVGAVAQYCETAVAMDWTKFPNRCFAHCTADLQTVGEAVALVRSPADAPTLTLVRPEGLPLRRSALDAPPPPTGPPPRIRFHRFLI